MDFMANHAILLNRGVLECMGTSFFRMAFITKFVYGIGFYHCLAIIRRTHSIVAARTVDLSLSDRMMRLFIGLRHDVLMTCETEVRFLSFEISLPLHWRMDRMAVVACGLRRLMPAQIPERQTP